MPKRTVTRTQTQGRTRKPLVRPDWARGAPRIAPKGKRCLVLDMNGGRCPKSADVSTYVFLEHELRRGVDWLVAYFCGDHYMAHENPADARWFSTRAQRAARSAAKGASR